ncbi:MULTISPECIES: hypothetical protein [unclassified Bradyrhizobium]|uniref:hypothetical protein n=1 Tax=unclassified Bradyrhizobium TaxID=2631580 RepID=UPI002915F237|nr:MULTISPECIES: hypothetical protein [unclassified Bradyrhizobium]
MKHSSELRTLGEGPDCITCTSSTSARYLAAVFAWLLAVLAAFSIWVTTGRDHFAAITAGRGPTWYQDLGGDAVTEIQDQDIFFHGIGSSISHLKQADVVIVGSSLVSFAIDGEIARARLARYGLKFYNFSFVGISSGEFTRRIVKRFGIRPKLWIINADDGGGGGHFFGDGVQRSFSGDVKTIAATQHGRLVALREVIRRNLRWRVEYIFKTWLHSNALERQDRVMIPRFYRNADDGDADMTWFPRYLGGDNPPVAIEPRAECHASEKVVEIARHFVATVGSRVVLTLVPNTYYCEQQARELAQALGIDLVLTGKTDYSSYDGGGHLDRKGRERFTADLMTALERFLPGLAANQSPGTH